MAHFVCNICGAVFSEDEAATETFFHDEVRPTYVEKFIACPRCLQANYDEAAYCYRCKKPMRYESLKGGYYCKDCLRDISTKYHEHLYAIENADDYAEWLHERRVKNKADEEDFKFL